MFKAVIKNTAALCMATAFGLAASAVSAETNLVSKDGSFKIVGELLSVDEDNYIIKTEFGELIVQREFVDCMGDGCPGNEAAAQDDTAIVLTSPDGNIRLEGTLLELTDTDYVIATINGDLTVRRELVLCEGALCPSTTAVTVQDEFMAVGPSDIGVNVLRTVIEKYSQAKSFTLTASAADEGGSDLFVGTQSGVEVARVAARGMDSDEAMRAVLNGQAAFALVRKRYDAPAIAALTGRSVASVDDVVIERTIGLDALSFVANPSNPLDGIATDDVRGILAGQITNWSQLGGPDGAINVHSLPLDAEVMTQVADRLMDGTTSAMAAKFTFHDNVDAMQNAINADPNGFGVVFRSRQGDLVPMELASRCDIFYGTSDFSVQTQEYPFAMGWYLYAAKGTAQSEFAKNVIAYLQTDDGQDALASLGLLSQRLRSAPMKAQGSRVLTGVLTNQSGNAGARVVARYLGEVANSKRLSTSLRFTFGSATPDGKAKEDIDRISAIIRQPAYANYEVKLVGFSDAIGSFNKNVSLSAARAGQIKTLLLNENPGWLSDENVKIMGAGPIAPVECNDTEEGRRLNRRVEVWLAPPVR